jgi:NTP pyrophosphatase (non-canonical NTP hydrolase)
MKQIQEVFAVQHDIQKLLGTPVGDSPEYFWKAIAGIHEEAEEAKKEDTRHKSVELNLPGCKDAHYDKHAKTLELADILIQVVNACLFSDISPDELSEAIRIKTSTKLEKFKRLKEGEA